jgi:hypothetical protein
MDANERARRYRARKRGEDVPKAQPGPKPGFKQSPEHVAKRAQWGPEHHAWMGENITEKGGRSRAQRRYRDIGPCWDCGAEKAERHHIDGDTANNDLSNIAIVCRRCHMQRDGRLDDFIELAKLNQQRAVAARWR